MIKNKTTLLIVLYDKHAISHTLYSLYSNSAALFSVIATIYHSKNVNFYSTHIFTL